METPSWVEALWAQARAHRQRRPLWISGEPTWCRAQAAAIVHAAGLPDAAVLWCGGHPPDGVTVVAPERAHHHLGGECRLLVIDAFDGFDPDAVGALSGTLVGGGLWLLLSPHPEDWPRWPDPQRRRITVAGYPETAVGGRFLARLGRLLTSDAACPHLRQGAPPPRLRERPAPPPAPPPDNPLCATRDQARAVEAVVRCALGGRRKPAVLTADRGRGKSAALGLAAARVLQAGRRCILVTAPRPAAVAALFRHAEAALPGAERHGSTLRWRDPRGAAGEIRFLAPDVLVETRPAADLVLVDEAAALPLPLLEAVLEHWPRTAFATTVHGYEGSGRGFTLRFPALLARHARGTREVHLRQPVRWAEGDPVEALVFRLLCLDAEPVPGGALEAAAPHREDRDRLGADEARLRHTFGLLVSAHYRTRPADLRHLLDGPNLSLHTLGRPQPLAVALCAREGGFDPDFAAAVWRGERRPHGHLLPESLAVHLGLAGAPRLEGMRIVRLAVHPERQGQGLGGALLDHLLEAARAEDLAYLGASFAGDARLLRFWTAHGLRPVRVSVGRSSVSGEHSVMVLAPLNGAGEALVDEARRIFAETLVAALPDHLRHLDPALVDALLPGLPPPPGRERPAEVRAYAHHRRLLEAALAPLTRAAWVALTDPARRARLEDFERRALVLRLLQKRDWADCARHLGLPGRAQVDALLRAAFRRLHPEV